MRGKRTQARSFALQLLYQAEISETAEPASAGLCWQEKPPTGETQTYADALVAATVANLAEIDARLTQNLERWKLTRLSVVVRNLLRMAVCEMIVMGEVPFQVVINEAVELARGFTDEDSSKFVNSVLEKCWVNAADGPHHRPATGGTE
jgi:N utilization substance protein B